MKNILLTLVMCLFTFGSSSSSNHHNDAYMLELRRQYQDYKRIFHKEHENTTISPKLP